MKSETAVLDELKAAPMEKVMEHVVEAAKSSLDKRPRIIDAINVGQYFEQGDVTIFRVSDNHPKGKAIKGEGFLKLAPGEQQGARHMLVMEDGVEVFEGAAFPETYSGDLGEIKERLGPCIKVSKTAEVQHPEHAHDLLNVAGTYQVMYQMDPKTMRRVQD